MKEKKFKPLITKITLNPEQAVLACECYNVGKWAVTGSQEWNQTPSCGRYTKGRSAPCQGRNNVASS